MNIKCLILSGVASVLIVAAFVWSLIFYKDIVAMVALVVGLAMIVVCIWALIYVACSPRSVLENTMHD